MSEACGGILPAGNEKARRSGAAGGQPASALRPPARPTLPYAAPPPYSGSRRRSPSRCPWAPAGCKSLGALFPFSPWQAWSTQVKGGRRRARVRTPMIMVQRSPHRSGGRSAPVSPMHQAYPRLEVGDGAAERLLASAVEWWSGQWAEGERCYTGRRGTRPGRVASGRLPRGRKLVRHLPLLFFGGGHALQLVFVIVRLALSGGGEGEGGGVNFLCRSAAREGASQSRVHPRHSVSAW